MVESISFSHTQSFTWLRRVFYKDFLPGYSSFDETVIKVILVLYFNLLCLKGTSPLTTLVERWLTFSGREENSHLLYMQGADHILCAMARCQHRHIQEHCPVCPVKFIVHSIKGSNGQQRGLNVSPVT